MAEEERKQLLTLAAQVVGAGVWPDQIANGLSPGTVRLEWFDSASEAEAAGRKLGREKERRGYRAIA